MLVDPVFHEYVDFRGSVVDRVHLDGFRGCQPRAGSQTVGMDAEHGGVTNCTEICFVSHVVQ